MNGILLNQTGSLKKNIKKAFLKVLWSCWKKKLKLKKNYPRIDFGNSNIKIDWAVEKSRLAWDYFYFCHNILISNPQCGAARFSKQVAHQNWFSFVEPHYYLQSWFYKPVCKIRFYIRVSVVLGLELGWVVSDDGEHWTYTMRGCVLLQIIGSHSGDSKMFW